VPKRYSVKVNDVASYRFLNMATVNKLSQTLLEISVLISSLEIK
jgi:hypothetical protein